VPATVQLAFGGAVVAGGGTVVQLCSGAASAIHVRRQL